MTDPDNLVREALDARDKAYAPYSGFRVGAAIKLRDGRIYTGANVENRSYGLTVCAERVALFRAVMEGLEPDQIEAVVIATDNDPPSSPCGACRQVLSEFTTDCAVVLINPAGVRVETTLAELIPLPFHVPQLKKR